MPAELVVRTFELGQRPLQFAETEMVMGFTPIPDDGTPPPSGTPIRNGRAQLRAEVDFDAIPEDGLNRSAHVALEVFDTATGNPSTRCRSPKPRASSRRHSEGDGKGRTDSRSSAGHRSTGDRSNDIGASIAGMPIAGISIADISIAGIPIADNPIGPLPR
jgi:hypothetical protein